MKNLMFLLVFAGLSFSANAQKNKVQWIELKDLENAYKNEPRPILIDLYTDWCGWCKRMEKDTYSNDSVANYINKNFWAVKYDAESKEPISINGKTFNYNKDYKVNEVAIALTYGQLAYPQTIFMDRIDNKPSPLAGYKKVSELEGPLKFFGEKAYEKMSFQDFMGAAKMVW